MLFRLTLLCFGGIKMMELTRKEILANQKIIGAWLRKIRGSAATQTEIAATVGYETLSAIHQIERGTLRIPLHMLICISKAYADISDTDAKVIVSKVIRETYPDIQNVINFIKETTDQFDAFEPEETEPEETEPKETEPKTDSDSFNLYEDWDC